MASPPQDTAPPLLDDDDAAIPGYLSAQSRWVLWREETRRHPKTGEVTKTKPPISWHTGKKCNVSDPTSWAEFKAVVEAVAKSRAWDGYGIALGRIDHLAEILIGADLDNCLDVDSNPTEWVLPFIAAMPSYAEISPGGRGLKILARIRLADLAEARRLLNIPESDKEQARTRLFGERSNGQHAPGAQLFLMKRYFTITSNHWPTSPEEVTLLTLEQIAKLAALFGPKPSANRANGSHHEADDDDETPDEATIRDKLAEAFLRNPRLKARWEGDTEGLNDTTRSGRDMSVLAMLVGGAFTKGEVRAALHQFEHGKAASEPARYFEQMWARTSAAPRAEPEPPPGWEEQHPPPDELAASLHNAAALKLITEQSVASTFVTTYRDDLRFNHSSNSWLIWAEHHWKPDQRKLAFAWAMKLCKQLAATIGAKGRLVVEKIRFSAAVEQGARALQPLSTAQEDWNADPWLLGTPGGVVDLRTSELRPGQRTDMITRVTACTPAETPDCPLWLGFLDYAMRGDDQRISFLQRYFGYCLTGITREEVFLFLFGLAGAGKGTLVETIAGIMGDYAGSTPMEVFTAQSWRPSEYYRADIAGKRLIVANEPERGAFWAEAFVKEMTGGDTLSGRHPAGRPFVFKPTHKPLLHGNHMPRLRGRSTGMERRLRILPFDRKADPPDPTLKTRLREEWPAILRWCIEGAMAWQKVGLQPPDAILAANASYFEAQDLFGRWIDECCTLDKNLQLEPARLRASFNTWAKANGEEELGGNAFAEAIDQFEGATLRRFSSHGKRWVKGIGLKPAQRGEGDAGDTG
jgi:putative DNA primase/helicase